MASQAPMEHRRSGSPPVPSPPTRTRSWSGYEPHATTTAARERYDGVRRSSSPGWGTGDSATTQQRGRSPVLPRGSGRSPHREPREQLEPPTARGRRTFSRGSPDRRRREDLAASPWMTPSPVPSQRSSGRSPKRELRYDPTPPSRGSPSPARRDRRAGERAWSPSSRGSPRRTTGSPAGGWQLSPAPSDDAAVVRSDAITKLRQDFSQREGRHCERAWAKRALVEVNFSSMEDFSAAYSWLLENVNELEMQDPAAPPSAFAKWLRSIGDWLELAPADDVHAFQEWKHERTMRPAWRSFQNEAEDLHSLWGGRWEVSYWLGLEPDDYKEVEVHDTTYVQVTLWTMDGSAARLASEGSDLRLHRGNRLAVELKDAYLNELPCMVKVVRTDQGVECIRDVEILSWEEQGESPASSGSESPRLLGRLQRLNDEKDFEQAALVRKLKERKQLEEMNARRRKWDKFQTWKRFTRQMAKDRRRVGLRKSPVQQIKHTITSRMFNRWAQRVRTNQNQRRLRAHLQERDLDQLANVWAGWRRYTRSMRQKRERRQHSPSSVRELRAVSPVTRLSSSSRARRSPSAARSPGRANGSRSSPQRPAMIGRSPNRSSRSRSRRASQPPYDARMSSDSGSSNSNGNSRNAPEPRRAKSASRSRHQSAARSPKRSPSHQRQRSPQYRAPSAGRGRDQPRRTKSGPTTLDSKRRKRTTGIDPAGGQVTDRRRMLRAKDTDDARWEAHRREKELQKQEARQEEKRRDKQRKREVKDRLARIEQEESERQRKHRTGDKPLSESEKIRRAAAAAARRVFEESGNPATMNFRAFITFRRKDNASNFVGDDEFQACSEIWTRYDKDKGAVKRDDLAEILTEMVHRGVITISDDGIMTATDEQSQQKRRADEDSKRSSVRTPGRQRGQERKIDSDSDTHGQQPRHLSTRMDSDGVRDLQSAVEAATKNGTVKRLEKDALEVEFLDTAKTGLMFSRRRFAGSGESSGESYFMVTGTKKDSEAARLEGLENVSMNELLLDTVNGAVVEVDDTYAAKVEDVFIKQARPVKLTLVTKEAYPQRTATSAEKPKPRASPTTPRATPRTGRKYEAERDEPGQAEVQDEPLQKWKKHPQLARLLQDKQLDEMEEKGYPVDCNTGSRTERLPITWWPKKSESDPLIIKEISASAQGAFAKAFQDTLTESMILQRIGSQDCSKIGYTKSINALQAALMPRSKTKLEFLSLEVKDLVVDDEPVDDDVAGYVRVKTDFPAEEDGDLEIRAGDYIVVLQKTDENWWHGYIEGEPQTEGNFPCSDHYVEEMSEDDWRREQRPESPTLQLEQYCKSCQVFFTTDHCPRRHNTQQYLPKQMAVHQRLPVKSDASSSSADTGRGRAASRPAPTSRPTSRTPAPTKPTASKTRTPQPLNARQKTIVEKLRTNLSSQAYGSQGQDPHKLFKKYDRDNDGAWDFSEFKDAVRKGGKITAAVLSDTEVRQIFELIDVDNNATLTVDELATFVWGDEGSSAEQGAALFAELRQQSVNIIQQRTGFIVPDDGGSVLWRKLSNGRHSLTMTNFDAGIKRNEPDLYNKDCLKQAFKFADDSTDGAIQRSEFRTMLDALVLFCGLQKIFEDMETTRDGRLSRQEFMKGLRKLSGSGDAKAMQRRTDGTMQRTSRGGVMMDDDEIERAFVAIDLDGGGSIRFSELCVWAGMMLKQADTKASDTQQDQAGRASAGSDGYGSSAAQDKQTSDPDYKWTSHPELKRILQDKRLDEMDERTVHVECKMGRRVCSLGITWWPKKSETDSLVVKNIAPVDSPFKEQLEQVTQCMILSKINGQECRGYTKSKQKLDAALKPNRVTTLEFASLEPKDDAAAAAAAAAAANEDGDVQGVLCYVRAVNDYAADQAGDLAFVVGDVIAVTEKTDDEWWHGYLDKDPEVEGDFPAKEYVEEIPSEPEPEPEPAQKRQWMYCKACKKLFDTEVCPGNHGHKDTRGGANYITPAMAVKDRWPNAQIPRNATTTQRSSPTGSSSSGYRSSPRYAGTASSTGSTPRQPSTSAGNSSSGRTATNRGAATAPKPGSQANVGQYCKQCKGCFTADRCPNAHQKFQYLPKAEAASWPGWNTQAVYKVR